MGRRLRMVQNSLAPPTQQFHSLRTVIQKSALITHTLSGFEILNDVFLIIKTWLLSQLFVNIFHQLNVFEEHK